METLEKVDVKKSRFSDAIWFDKAKNSTAIIGGVGNIGSWTALFLARQGVTLYAYDFDTVDEVNLASQLYPISSIGEQKTAALQKTLCGFVDKSYETNFNVVGKLSSTNCVVDKYCFSCFDNMAARKLLFETWVANFKDTKDAIFIDGRLLAEIGQVFFVTTDRIEEYRATLFDDNEVPLENCAYKGTTHCSAIIAGIIVSGFNNFLVNLDYPVRNLPFNIDYQLPLFNFELKWS